MAMSAKLTQKLLLGTEPNQHSQKDFWTKGRDQLIIHCFASDTSEVQYPLGDTWED